MGIFWIDGEFGIENVVQGVIDGRKVHNFFFHLVHIKIMKYYKMYYHVNPTSFLELANINEEVHFLQKYKGGNCTLLISIAE